MDDREGKGVSKTVILNLSDIPAVQKGNNQKGHDTYLVTVLVLEPTKTHIRTCREYVS